MENIITELNGIKYLVVEELITKNNETKLKNKIKKFNCIYQGVKELKTSFWSGNYAIIKILVPEGNVIEFNLDGL